MAGGWVWGQRQPAARGSALPAALPCTQQARHLRLAPPILRLSLLQAPPPLLPQVKLQFESRDKAALQAAVEAVQAQLPDTW